MTLASTPSTTIQLCGPTVIERGGQRLEHLLPGRQGRLLFAYLVIKRHRLTDRDELIDAIWPQQQPPACDTALNALISKLRKALGPGTLEGRSSLRLRLEADARIDVEVANEAVHRAQSQVALGAWKQAWGPSLTALFIAERVFMPGEDAPWIDQQRRHLGEVRINALEAYAESAVGVGGTELPAAVRAGRELVRLVPLRERAYQLLMRILAARSDVAEALRVYSDLCAILRDELGITPTSASQAVYAELLKLT